MRNGVQQTLQCKNHNILAHSRERPPIEGRGHLYASEPVVEITLGLDRSRDS